MASSLEIEKHVAEATALTLAARGIGQACLPDSSQALHHVATRGIFEKRVLDVREHRIGNAAS